MSLSHIAPFPGLRSFQAGEDFLFFGREEQITKLLAVLKDSRFMAVVGTSGSGKSSLVRAGLLPALHGGTMSQAGSHWEEVVMRPGGDPMSNLARALLEADFYDATDPETLPRVRATLDRSRFGLVEAVRQSEVKGTNVLVVVDQFEELFRFRVQDRAGKEAAAAFVKLLLTASESNEVPVYVVITMRSDYLGDCAHISGLAEAVNRGEYLIPQLRRHQRRDAIEKPALVAGGRLAPRLVQQLLNDVGDDQDELPILQHALMRMWDHWKAKQDGDADPHERGSVSSFPPIDLQDYEEIGGLREALSRHADEVYAGLPDARHREVGSRMFMALTERGPDNRGIRRPTRFDRLCAIVGSDEPVLRRVIEEFRSPGRTFLMPPLGTAIEGDTVIDISHESLMRVWVQLRGWVEEEAQSARVYRRLAETAQLHAERKAGLYHDPDLQIALSWWESRRPTEDWGRRYHEKFGEAMTFLEASRVAAERVEKEQEAARQRELEQARVLAEARQLRLEEEQRSARKLRVVIACLAVLAVIAGVACVAALVANNKANDLAQRTADALTEVASQKTQVEQSLTKARESEQLARRAEEVAKDAEEEGRKLLYTTDMQLAPFVWRDNQATLEQLRNLLDKHTPEINLAQADTKEDLRGFEWYYHKHLVENAATVLAGHGVVVTDCALTSDGQVVTLDNQSQSKRWDLDTSRETGSRDLGLDRNVRVRVLSPNGRLAALGVENNVLLLDSETGEQFFQFASANMGDRQLIFSPDSRMLVVVDKKIQWFDTAEGKGIASVDWGVDGCGTVALAADGLTLVVGRYGSLNHKFAIYRLDPIAKTIKRQREVSTEESLSVVALSPDGGLLAVGNLLSGSVSIYDTSTGRGLAEQPAAHPSPISAVAFSADGKKLATAAQDGTIKIWADARRLDFRSEPERTLKGHGGAVTKLFFSVDATRLVSSSEDTSARIWEVGQPAAGVQELESVEFVFKARFSPDGQLIAAGSGSRVALWDAATGQRVNVLWEGDGSGIYSVAFSPDNRLLAVSHGSSGASEVMLWDIDTRRQIATFPGVGDLPNLASNTYTGTIGTLAFSPDGRYLVAGFGTPFVFDVNSNPIPLKVWEVATRRLVRRLNGHTGHCVSVQFSPDGALLASASHDGTARIWSTETWETLRTLRNPNPSADRHSEMVQDVAFSPDGQTLATASLDRKVRLWSVATGAHLKTLEGHSGDVYAVVFSPDGRTLVSGSADLTVRLWNLATGRELMRLDTGNSYVRTLAFSPDGKQLLAGGGAAVLWSAAPVVWNNPELAAERLGALLDSAVDFQTRVRMLSEHKRLHEGLAIVQRLRPAEERVQAALAAALANWHASHQRWPEAVKEFDRLVHLSPTDPSQWLRMPGLLRLATALFHQQRPAEAATLLTGGEERRRLDGLSAATVGYGIVYIGTEDTVRVLGVAPGSSAARRHLFPDDIILQINDVEMTKETIPQIGNLFAGEIGKVVRLRVRHPGIDQPEEIELTRERFLKDIVTSDLLSSLRADVSQQIVREPDNPELLRLRAELVGQWSDSDAQVADYTTAIELLSGQAVDVSTAELRRIYRGRGDAMLAQRNWQGALDDYSRAGLDESADEEFNANRTIALANALLESPSVEWNVLEPVELVSAGGSTLNLLEDGSILASGNNPYEDSYTITCGSSLQRITAVRLEVLPDASLPSGGPGRYPRNGNFHLNEFLVFAGDVPKALSGIAVSYAEHDQYRQIIDGVVDTKNWGVNGREGEQNSAVFGADFTLTAGEPLKFELFFSRSHTQHGLGRFRLSVTDASDAFQRENQRIQAMEITDPWVRLAAAYQSHGDSQAVDRLVERRPAAAGSIGDLYAAAEDWQPAIAMYSKGIMENPADSKLYSRRARAYEQCQDWEAAAADWSRAGGSDLERAKIYAEFAQRLAGKDQHRLAASQSESARRLYEKALDADPSNEILAEELPQLLLDTGQHATEWRVLEPVEMKSESGAALTLQNGGWILSNAQNPETEIYTIVCKTGPIQALRVEFSDSPPNAGTDSVDHQILFLKQLASKDAAVRGQFVRVGKINDRQRSARDDRVLSLAEVEVFQGAENLALTGRARQSSMESRRRAERAIDGDLEGSLSEVTYTHPDAAPWWELDLGAEKDFDRIVIWNRRTARTRHRLNNFSVWVYDSARKPVFTQFTSKAPIASRRIRPWAVVESPAPAEAGGQTRLTVRLSPYGQRKGPYRFRLAVTEDVTALEQDIQRVEAINLTDPWVKLGAAFALEGDRVKAVEFVARGLDRAADPVAKAKVVDEAARDVAIFEQLAASRPEDPVLQVAWLRSLAGRVETLPKAETPHRASQWMETLLPSSEKEGTTWRFTTTKPTDAWMEPGFDDLNWMEATGGFGTELEGGVRTEWSTADIWLRRSFEIPADAKATLLALLIRNDDGAEVYFNGKEVANLPRWTPVYKYHALEASACDLLVPGTNTIAVHCHNTSDAGAIDVGVFGRLEKRQK